MTCKPSWGATVEMRRCLLAFLLLTITISDVHAAEKPRKALFVIVDGIPADVTPTLDEIAVNGGYTHAYVGGEAGGESESPTISAVGYQSLLTGTWANKHNVWGNSIDDPDYRYWDIFRIVKHHDPGLGTAIFSTWEDNRTKLVGDGLPVAGGQKIDHAVDGLEHDHRQFPKQAASGHIRAIDSYVASEAADHIATHGPHLSWIYLQFTDDVGHRYGDGPEMDEAVTFTDGLLAPVWEAVQARMENLDEDWLVVVTTDHGRVEVDGKGHGGQSHRERLTWIVTNGRCLSPAFRQTPGIVDILPSILDHLQIRPPADVASALDGTSFLCP